LSKGPKPAKAEVVESNAVSVAGIGDLHSGCRMGLCHAKGVRLEGGGFYRPSPVQRWVHGKFEEFRTEFVPRATKGEKYALVVNGDALDGVHHGSTTQVSHNMVDQLAIAEAVLRPFVEQAKGGYYHIRGTEAHVGQSGEFEERLARMLGAIPDAEGNYARWALRLRIGDHLTHWTHHISASTSPFAQSSALQREQTKMFVHTGKWRDDPYSLLVRSHRHVHSEISERASFGKVTTLVLPAWQMVTPYVYKVSPMSQPEVGGSIVRLADDELFTRTFLKRVDPPREERLR